ncbi:MAG: DUF1501 domain-containing protein [Gemmataceae bacterium]
MSPHPRRSGMTRREILRLGSLTLAGLGVNGIAPWSVAGANDTSDTSVILLWLPGGPPHMETFDMKPGAPAEYRGIFRPIKTNVPGIDVCELLPRHAHLAHRYSLIRSIHHTYSDHGGGHKKFLTGRDPFLPVEFVNDYPMVGSYVSRLCPPRRAGVPNYVAGTDAGRDGIDVFSFGSAYLGPSAHPFMVGGDPSSPRFQVANLTLRQGLEGRLDGRASLLEQLDRPSNGRDGALDGLRRRGFELLTSDEARKAFDLTRESPRLRERYGMGPWGQRCLMARRLVESGARFVTMVLENPMASGQPLPKDTTYNWDSHAVNCHIFTDCHLRLPILDQAVTALIEDIFARGLDRKVLLIVTGEFGRTPRISYDKGRPGRDHWPQAMSVLVSGGGLRMGQVVGSTNPRGEHPKDRPLTPNDLWATMFRHLNIDPETLFYDRVGRPLPILAGGEPISELI